MKTILVILLALSLYANVQTTRFGMSMYALSSCGPANVMPGEPYADWCGKVARDATAKESAAQVLTMAGLVAFSDFQEMVIKDWVATQPR